MLLADIIVNNQSFGIRLKLMRPDTSFVLPMGLIMLKMRCVLLMYHVMYFDVIRLSIMIIVRQLLL